MIRRGTVGQAARLTAVERERRAVDGFAERCAAPIAEALGADPDVLRALLAASLREHFEQRGSSEARQ